MRDSGETELQSEDIYRIKKEAIDELRMHFVFNILNAIRYLIKNDQDKAYDVVYDLAQFMRGNIQSVAVGGIISLEEELSFVHSYMKLEQVQKGRLAVNWDVENVEGYVVACGSIYTALEKLLKEDFYIHKHVRTFSIQKDSEEEIVRISIAETGKEVVIPTYRRSTGGDNENDIGR